jgi:hypothetical protein
LEIIREKESEEREEEEPPSLHTSSSTQNNRVSCDGKMFDYVEVVLRYNVAACYWRLSMLEECADHLDCAVRLLSERVAKV